MAPERIDKNIKRREILLAAMKVFGQKGLREAKVADIAAAAGIGKGTIYEYFKSREDIFNEVFLFMLAELGWDFEAELTSKRSPTVKLKRITSAIFSSLANISE